MTIMYADTVEYGGEIFKEHYSARNASLGGTNTYVAGSNNPALLFYTSKSFLDFSHMNKYGGLSKLSSISYLFTSNKSDPVFISMINRIVDDISDTREAWNDNGDLVPEPGEINYFNIKKFSQKELGLKLSFCKKYKRYYFGTSLKPSYTSVAGFKAYGMSTDIALSTYFYKKILNLNFRVEDIISFKKWSTESTENIIPFVAIGGTFNFNNMLLSFQMASDVSYGSPVYYNSGFEYQDRSGLLVFRSGFSNFNSFTLGLGLKLFLINVDYAFLYPSSNSPFEPSQILSLTINLDNKNWIKGKLNP